MYTGTLSKKLLIGDVEVDVPLPCLPRQRKLSLKTQQKQIKKKQVRYLSISPTILLLALLIRTTGLRTAVQ